jgi:holo-[acyl-carrier protein] synthase
MGGICDVVLGTDVVHLPRLEAAYERYGLRFFERLLTAQELVYCEARGGDAAGFCQRAAGRIAVKEAVSKALGVGVRGLGWQAGVRWHSVEVKSVPQRPPELILQEEALERAVELGITAWRISWSHDGPVAMATVVGLVSQQ